MINAYAAQTPGGKLEPFQYDPGELAATDVEINVAHLESGKARYRIVLSH